MGTVHFGPTAPEGTRQAKIIGKKLARIVHIMCDKNMVEIEAVDHDILFDEHGLLGYVSTISIALLMRNVNSGDISEEGSEYQ